MYDDPLDLPRAFDRDFGEILSSAGVSSYYRPLPLIIWKALYLGLGRNDPVVLHALGLAAHAAAGWLVYEVGRRLLSPGRGVAAALLFLWYPPSFQAVGFVNSFFHGLVAICVLAAAVLYWDSRVGEVRERALSAALSPVLLAAALAMGALGLLSHESGVAIAVIIPALEVLVWRTVRQGGSPGANRGTPLTPTLAREGGGGRSWPSPLALLFVAEVAGFGVLWLLVPREPAVLHFDPLSIRSSGLYFVQGLTAPVSGLLGYLPDFGWSPGALVLGAGTLSLAGLMAVLKARRRLLVGAFGLVWFAAAVLPVGLTRPWDTYVSNGPRLLYLASVGMALVWAAALTPSGLRTGFHPHPDPPLRSAESATQSGSGSSTGTRFFEWAGLLVVAAILVSSYMAIARLEAVQAQGAEIVSRVIETATQDGPEAGRVYVNVPAFIAPREAGFVLGHWGITMLPEYVQEPGLVPYIARGVRPPLVSVAYTEIAQQWDHFYGMHGPARGLQELQPELLKGGGVYMTRFRPGRLQLEYAGRVETGVRAPPVGLARFGDWAVLEQARASVEDERIVVRLAWLALAPAPGDFTVFLHLVGGSSEPLQQADGYPIGALFPPQGWRQGDRVYDARYLPLASGSLGTFRLLVGFYDRAAPERRASAFDSTGNALPDGAFAVRLGS